MTDAVSPVQRLSLGLHVINGGWGESIILELPDGRWGVIDCYAQDVAEPASNPTLHFLRDRGVTELEFVALTHPHSDHFRGLCQLFETMTVRQFWRYAATSPKDLASWQVGFLAQTGETGEADDLLRLLETTTDLRKRRLLKFKHLEDVKTLYRTTVKRGEGTADAVLCIRCIAPSSEDVERYQQMLHRCFDADRRLKEPAPSLPHNLVSAALVVEYGATRVILGGDVEKQSWGRILQEQGADALQSQAVKVSHHGSRNGYCQGLWSAFCQDGEPIAVITPYRQQSLPEQAAYRHIHSHTPQTVTTCLSAVPFGTTPRHDLWPHYDANVQLTLRAFFPSFRADRGYTPGMCSFYFDAHRRRIPHENEFSGAAGPL